MDKFAGMTITEFDDALASSAPAPGGGGAAALAGALAAALGSMVCSLTSGKKSYAQYEEDIRRALEQLEAARRHLVTLIDEDARAFAPLQKYLSMPKDSPERREHMDAALRVACYVPTDVLYTCEDVAGLLAPLAEHGLRGAISDIGVGLELCRAAMRAARMNILINASIMPDEVFAMTLRRECELVLGRCEPVIDAALERVEARLGLAK